MAQVAFCLELGLIPDFEGTIIKCPREGSTLDEVVACRAELPLRSTSKQTDSINGSRRDTQIDGKEISNGTFKMLSHSPVCKVEATRHHFDEDIVTGNDGSSKLHKAFVDCASEKAMGGDGKKSQMTKILEPQLMTLQQKEQEECSREHQGGINVQTSKENSPMSKNRLVAGLWEYMKPKGEKQGLRKSYSFERCKSLSNVSETNSPSDDVGRPSTISLPHLKLTADVAAESSIAKANKEHIDDAVFQNEHSHGSMEHKPVAAQGSFTGPQVDVFMIKEEECMVANDGECERINVGINRVDGVIILRDHSHKEVRLELEILDRVKKNIQPLLLRIIKERPYTFINVGKLSSRYRRLNLEAFGFLLELLEQTKLKDASPNIFDEMLGILDNMKRNLFKVDWLEDSVRALATQVRHDSKVRLTNMKIVECEVQLAELQEKKKNLELKVRQLRKQHQVDFHFDMEGYADQLLF